MQTPFAKRRAIAPPRPSPSPPRGSFVVGPTVSAHFTSRSTVVDLDEDIDLFDLLGAVQRMEQRLTLLAQVEQRLTAIETTMQCTWRMLDKANRAVQRVVARHEAELNGG